MTTKLRFAGSGYTSVAARNLAMFQWQQFCQENPHMQVIKTFEEDLTVRTGNRNQPLWPLHLLTNIVADQLTEEEQAEASQREPRAYYDGVGPIRGNFSGYRPLVCPWCTRPFYPRGSRQVFCSEEHRLQFELEEIRNPKAQPVTAEAGVS